jgi:hypothetical protein
MFGEVLKFGGVMAKQKAEELIVETRYVKHIFCDKELLELSRKMTGALSCIEEKADELKTASASIKAEIAEQEAILHGCADKLKTGYDMRPRQCTVTYENNNVRYIDKETGEILEEHPMTEDEQLRLTGVRIDAEDIIRQARQEED